MNILISFCLPVCWYAIILFKLYAAQRGTAYSSRKIGDFPVLLVSSSYLYWWSEGNGVYQVRNDCGHTHANYKHTGLLARHFHAGSAVSGQSVHHQGTRTHANQTAYRFQREEHSKRKRWVGLLQVHCLEWVYSYIQTPFGGCRL